VNRRNSLLISILAVAAVAAGCSKEPVQATGPAASAPGAAGAANPATGATNPNAAAQSAAGVGNFLAAFNGPKGIAYDYGTNAFIWNIDSTTPALRVSQ